MTLDPVAEMIRKHASYRTSCGRNRSCYTAEGQTVGIDPRQIARALRGPTVDAIAELVKSEIDRLRRGEVLRPTSDKALRARFKCYPSTVAEALKRFSSEDLTMRRDAIKRNAGRRKHESPPPRFFR